MLAFARTNTFLTCAFMLLFIAASARTACLAAESDSNAIVIAHRGASGYLPEHTLPAVAMAHAQGADFIEQDIVLSKDNEPMVIHDLILDNVTNVAEAFPKHKRNDGHYYVGDFTLAELRTLQVHERVDARLGRPTFPRRFPSGEGRFGIATLAEHIELIQGLNRSTGRNVGLLVELKEPSRHLAEGRDMGRIVLETLAKYGYKDRDDMAILQSFDAVEMRRLRKELHTDLRIVQLMNEETLKLPTDASREQMSAALAKVSQYADGVGPSLEMLLSRSRIPGNPQLAELIELAHAAKLTVYCYTFRTETVPQQFAGFAKLVEAFDAAEIDGFITDFPDKVRESLSAVIR
jgi:glycerophosphoryl diester phosphodiesterase